MTLDQKTLSDGPIHLRRLTLDDVDEWLAGQDDEQNRWFEFPRPAERADVERAITNWAESWRTSGPVRHWAICDTETGRIAGGVEVRLQDHEVNLSYVVFPGFRRRGYATRAAKLALDYATEVLGAATAVIKVLEGNQASLAVAKRLGATVIGTSPSDTDGTFVVHRLTLNRQS
ncbi:MAG: GNAT family N-acetyltransferase [Actinomycetota bacterium]